MNYNSRMCKFFIVLFFLSNGCIHSWKEKVYKKDREFIIKGVYPFQTYSLMEDEYKNIVSSLRKDIEKNIGLLDSICKIYFETYHPPFKYHISMIDRERNNLIIKYFSRFLKHKIYAGISIQFVYSIKDKKFEKIYVDLIPLE